MTSALIEEVATFLGAAVTSEQDAVDRLVAYQRANHPDLYEDYMEKHEATRRFKDAGALLSRLRIAVERGAAVSSSSAIAVHQGDRPFEIELVRSKIDASAHQQEVLILKEKNESLRRNNRSLRDENNKLKAQLGSKLEKRLERARQEVVKPYRPTRRTAAAVGITAALAALGALLTELEAVFTKVLAPLNVSSAAAQLVFAGLFLTTLSVAAFRYAKVHIVQGAADGLLTTASLRAFVGFAAPPDKVDESFEFGETKVIDFVRDTLKPRGAGKWIGAAAGVYRFSPQTVNDMKDVLIVHMLNSGLIEGGPSHLLERIFRVKSRPKYTTWTDFQELLEPSEDDDSDDDERF